ncbi:hypothetical protein DFH08DRAFT_1002111 [Mycena albidolilacea]|uniref:Uncharacterized protein n=1 Tax=Mycena albidolilacea TaxID=1033008 RepID=A0AAD7EQI9_9AGAR|nr:hypothetical protein DFH08DRAFT_1002111 [Mycena albidolilacea]
MPSDVEYLPKVVVFNAFFGSIINPIDSPPRFWLVVWKSSASSELLHCSTTSMHLLGTVAIGTSSFSHEVVSRIKSYGDSGERVRNLDELWPPFIPLRIGGAAHHLVPHLLFPHCGAGGSMMNTRGRDGTSDVRTANESPRSTGKCGGTERRKGATALIIRICRGTTFPWRAKEVRRQRKNGSAKTALHFPQRGAMTEMSGVGCSEQAGRLRRGGKGEVWRGLQGARTLETQGAVQDVLPAKLRSQAAQCTHLIANRRRGSLVVTLPPASHAAAPAQRLSASALTSAQPPMYGEMFEAYLTAANVPRW